MAIYKGTRENVRGVVCSLAREWTLTSEQIAQALTTLEDLE